MKKVMLNKLIYALDALFGLVLFLCSFLKMFRTGTEVVNDAGQKVMEYKWFNFYDYCNFEKSGMNGVFMYAPLVLMLICVVVLICLIFSKDIKKFDNLVVTIMFVAVIIMAILQSFGYSYPFMIAAYVVAALLLISLFPLIALDKSKN